MYSISGVLISIISCGLKAAATVSSPTGSKQDSRVTRPGLGLQGTSTARSREQKAPLLRYVRIGIDRLVDLG
jgi:hypothetical protein